MFNQFERYFQKIEKGFIFAIILLIGGKTIKNAMLWWRHLAEHPCELQTSYETESNETMPEES